MALKSELLALALLGLVVLTVALPVSKTEEKKVEAEKPKEEHGSIKYDEGLAEDDPRNRPDVSDLTADPDRNSC